MGGVKYSVRCEYCKRIKAYKLYRDWLLGDAGCGHDKNRMIHKMYSNEDYEEGYESGEDECRTQTQK